MEKNVSYLVFCRCRSIAYFFRFLFLKFTHIEKKICIHMLLLEPEDSQAM